MYVFLQFIYDRDNLWNLKLIWILLRQERQTFFSGYFFVHICPNRWTCLAIQGPKLKWGEGRGMEISVWIKILRIISCRWLVSHERTYSFRNPISLIDLNNFYLLVPKCLMSWYAYRNNFEAIIFKGWLEYTENFFFLVVLIELTFKVLVRFRYSSVGF